MGLTIVIAICTLVLSIISIVSSSGRSRIVLALAIVAAVGIFVLGGIKEMHNYESEQELLRKIGELNESAASQSSRLDINRTMLERSIREARDTSRLLSLLEESSRGQTARVAVSEYSFADMSRDMDLRDSEGKPLVPVRGDEIEWQITCQGSLPSPSENGCDGFGKLQANSYPIPLSSSSGKKIFFGTRSTGGTMFYSQACRVIDSQLERASCSFEVQINRELRMVQLERLNNEGLRMPASGDPTKSTLCQMYERLYPGLSCDSLVGGRGGGA